MTRIASRGPLGQKAEKAKPDPAYLAKVRQLPCRCCGGHGPNEAHHCRDLPDFLERGLYQRLPGAAQKSHDRDAIPLCPDCHWLFHNRRAEFHARIGKDYTHIGAVRAILSDMIEGS
jgi:hypothetical protein